MALTTEDRARIYRGLMRWWSRLWEGTGAMAQADILAAVVVTDDWIESNAASYNAALPQPFQGSATAEQKTLLFCAVALARVSMAMARQVFGEVD